MLDKIKQLYVNPFASHQANGARRTTIATITIGGFTIIEVLIVLAIAALILLVVFLAVPALQRSQRNSARKNDAARVAASVVEYTSNNNGPPTLASHCTSIKNASATLSQYSSLAASCATEGTALPATPTANTMYIEVMAANGTAGTATTNVMMLATKSSCSGSSAVTFDRAISNKIALLYTIEAGTGWGWVCLNAQ